ncbi:ATP-binding protein [Xanthomonas sp. CFBP 8445]|uniref:ATP-binding protein n=1 Tax=Xanthomonas sp. CFBP 8445 TaxID=2971236 RepID=UPI0021E0C2E3|nr:ATP-binding protein [Xanthomonas sp. CFBP 8445]UYC12862.1 ATP-binding protein [Xanthomonas sp. CFBP 8445]
MQLHEVFGVARDQVESYIERNAVDTALQEALAGSRQIVIYGSSKQGKTSLLQRHVAPDDRITVHCGPTMSVEDIYRSLLRQQGVEIVTERSVEQSREVTTSISARFKAMIPLFGGGEAETAGGVSAGRNENELRTTVEFNLANGQDVGELLIKIGSRKKYHVLENFHYLSDEAQNQLAFDLRTFEEMGIRFVILGVWRERNRLVQYNGDLQDRVAEVPVEPWDDGDFERVALKGEAALNVKISPALKQRIFNEAHGSIGVVQELLKKLCELAGVMETSLRQLHVERDELLSEAITAKVAEYSSRHVRSLEAIAAGSRSRRATEETAALFLPYYVVLVLVNRSYAELRDGIERKTLQEHIRAIHTHPENVRTSDVTGMLQRLSKLQADAKIKPPLFDFDPGSRRVKVVDSTLYFFIDNCVPADVMAEIPHPDPDISAAQRNAPVD